ncbi:hypothetical protein ACFLQU_03770 [Verrucomicrobiota bacterium]
MDNEATWAGPAVGGAGLGLVLLVITIVGFVTGRAYRPRSTNFGSDTEISRTVAPVAYWTRQIVSLIFALALLAPLVILLVLNAIEK